MVRGILKVSEKRNAEQEITGALLATHTHFLQVIEGTFEAINKTFMRIARDSRHQDLVLVSYSLIDVRLFDGWSMRGVGVFDFNKEIEAELSDKYGSEDGSVRFPLEEWQVLAMINDIRMMDSPPTWKT